ncbi:ester cyclase [Chitinophaga agrisoli]|uniref:Ester cyclase n=1 Tax=Chitinophaga agrisoli TaxID=2607653 RepID=A0A5B2VNT4_9BACT|nr:ester cyclase [Chitinophaga agrisoli]KAA2240444.1 ester cyclase [Chitinophaga agrisoli]
MLTSLEQNKAIVRRFNEAFIAQGNQQAFEEIVAADFINHTAASINLPGDREAVSHFIVNVLRQAVKDITVEIYDQVAEGDTVVTRKAIRGIQTGGFMGIPGNGQPFTMHIIDIVRLRNGQYTEHWSLRSIA